MKKGIRRQIRLGTGGSASVDRDEPRVVPSDEYEPLFSSMAYLGGASCRAIHEMFFARKGVSLRNTQMRLQGLQKHEFIQRVDLPGRGRDSVLQLTGKGYRSFPSVDVWRTSHNVRALTVERAIYCWVRSELLGSFVKDGWSVGRDDKALLALRRSLIDRQKAKVASLGGAQRAAAEQVLKNLRASPALAPTPATLCPTCGPVDGQRGACPTCGGTTALGPAPCLYRCPRCGEVSPVRRAHACGPWRAEHLLPIDVAYRRREGTYEAVIVLVDEPFSAVGTQLSQLPLRTMGQPILDVVVAPTDRESIYDLGQGAWAFRSRRFVELVSAFEEGGSSSFPYWHVARLITPYPDIAFRTVGKRKQPA